MTYITKPEEASKGDVSYEWLAKQVGGMVLCNNINNVDEFYITEGLQNGYLFDGECGNEDCEQHGEWDEETAKSGYCSSCGKETGDAVSIYQTFIITLNGAEWLKENTNELVFYSDVLDVYIWGITHWGMSWSHVFTRLK